MKSIFQDFWIINACREVYSSSRGSQRVYIPKPLSESSHFGVIGATWWQGAYSYSYRLIRYINPLFLACFALLYRYTSCPN
jgi:hypothetical protein